MAHNIKIYFDDRVLLLTDKENGNDMPDTFKNTRMLAKELEKFAEAKEPLWVIKHSDIGEMLEKIKACCTFIEAAGGLVSLSDKRILFIRRFGKWDLPKGKAEKGETLEATAVREVVEECGLATLPQITKKIIDTYHTYHHKGKHVLKRTAWYAMTYDGDEALHPQLSEDITEAVWCAENQTDRMLRDTYGSVRQVFEHLKYPLSCKIEV